MAIEFRCPGCNRLLRVGEGVAGKRAKCPECGTVLIVPSPPPPPPPVPRGLDPPTSEAVAAADYVPANEQAVAVPVDGLPQKPGKVQAMAIMTLIGGILAAIGPFSILSWAWIMCFLPLILIPYEIVLAILAIMKAVKLLGADAYRDTPPKVTAIMQIVNIVALDMVNCGMGIAILVLCSDPAVKAYFRGGPGVSGPRPPASGMPPVATPDWL
jgi:hypothetical protein